VRDENPQNWRLDVPQDRIDLYLELLERPRPLTEFEAQMMVELVDAWRALEHEKHIALMAARAHLPYRHSRVEA
jgi:hypothetical protein